MWVVYSSSSGQSKFSRLMLLSQATRQQQVSDTHSTGIIKACLLLPPFLIFQRWWWCSSSSVVVLCSSLTARSCRIEIAVAHCQLHACFLSHHHCYRGYQKKTAAALSCKIYILSQSGNSYYSLAGLDINQGFSKAGWNPRGKVGQKPTYYPEIP